MLLEDAFLLKILPPLTLHPLRIMKIVTAYEAFASVREVGSQIRKPKPKPYRSAQGSLKMLNVILTQV